MHGTPSAQAQLRLTRAPKTTNITSTAFADAAAHVKAGRTREALLCARLAEQQGFTDALISVGKLFQRENISLAKDYFGLAVEMYQHRKAALELISLKLQETFSASDIRELHRIVVSPRLVEEVTEENSGGDRLVRIELCELYLQRNAIDWWSDYTSSAKDALLGIDDAIRVDDIPGEYPLTRALASAMSPALSIQ